MRVVVVLVDRMRVRMVMVVMLAQARRGVAGALVIGEVPVVVMPGILVIHHLVLGTRRHR